MSLERCRLAWPPSEYYWLSPDGDTWLEVSAETYHQARAYPEEEVLAALRKKIEGDGTMLPMTAARRWLQQQAAQPDRTATWD